MASFEKRGDTWQFRTSVISPSGKRERISRSGFKTRSKAKIAAAKLELEYSDGMVIKITEKTLVDYFQEWYETNIEPHIRPASVRHYKSTIHNLEKSTIGNYQMKRITTTNYQKFINEFGENHALWTVKKMSAQIRACARDAVFKKELPQDFTQGVKLVYDETRSHEATWLNEAEMKSVLQNCSEYVLKSGRPINRYMIIIDLLTGLRLGELLALTWGDIDFENKTIDVNKSWDYVDSKMAPTKTKSSIRTIVINDDCANTLEQLFEYQDIKNNTESDTQIFLNHYHLVPSPAGVNKTLHTVLKECEITKVAFHFHSLRHTHASYLLYSGVSILAISKRLGHRNTRITLDVYSHMVDEMENREADKISETLNSLTK